MIQYSDYKCRRYGILVKPLQGSEYRPGSFLITGTTPPGLGSSNREVPVTGIPSLRDLNIPGGIHYYQYQVPDRTGIQINKLSRRDNIQVDNDSIFRILVPQVRNIDAT
jgi:hypothetical protein